MVKFFRSREYSRIGKDEKMRSCVAVVLVAAILSCSGCRNKDREAEPGPAPDVNDQKAQQTEPPQQSNPEAEKAATEAAGAWLALLDSGKYSESWQECAELFRKLVTKDRHEEATKALRTSLGKVLSREIKSTLYTTTAPGAPDAQYVIIQYKTSFENKKSAVETVTPMLDKDGKWRVSGYYIK